MKKIPKCENKNQNKGIFCHNVPFFMKQISKFQKKKLCHISDISLVAISLSNITNLKIKIKIISLVDTSFDFAGFQVFLIK